MGNLRRARNHRRLLRPLVLAGLIVLAPCLSAMTGVASAAVVAPARHQVLATANAHGTATAATAAAAAAAVTAATAATARASTPVGGLPAGGVLGDVTGDGLSDILAIDHAGNLWLYPNTGSGDAAMFAGGRSQVGRGWSGYTLAAVSDLYGAADNFKAGIVAIDPAGNLWYYPNTGGAGFSTFGARSQLGSGWTGYTVAGVAGFGSGFLDIVAIDPAGNLWDYPGTGMTGLSTFGPRIQLGSGWTGYTADVANINGDGRPDIVAVDPGGNLLLYLNTNSAGSLGPSTFAAPVQVGSGWSGFQALDLGFLTSASSSAVEADILAVDAGGNLWYYPGIATTGGTGTNTFGAPTQVGSGWTSYTIN